MYINRKTGELIHEQTLKELKLWEDKDFQEQYGEAMICLVDKRDCGLLCKGEHCGIHSKLIDCGITCEDKKYPCIPYIPEEYDVDNEPTFPICGTCNYIKDKNLEQSNFPKIVCLCGSTRFKEQFFDTAKSLTCNRVIVLAPFHFRKCGDTITPELENILEELHFRKIDLADEILVLNIGGYIGESTRKEIEYAKSHNKIIGYLEEIE